MVHGAWFMAPQQRKDVIIGSAWAYYMKQPLKLRRSSRSFTSCLGFMHAAQARIWAALLNFGQGSKLDMILDL